jgi:hypothetical protein
MPDIHFDVDYFSHPKTIRLIGILGKGSEVLPIRLWCWCAKYHSENGILADYSTDEIESVVAWWGEKGKFCEAMLKVGFLEQGKLGFYVHDFTSINGHLAAFKERSRKGNEARWRKIREGKEAESPPDPLRSPLGTPTRTPCEPIKESSYVRTNVQTNETATARADALLKGVLVEKTAGTPVEPVKLDLESLIYDRVGWKKRLSRFDLDKVLAMKAKHGDKAFLEACDKLHGGVTNIPAYLLSVLEGKEQSTGDLATRAAEILNAKKARVASG